MFRFYEMMCTAYSLYTSMHWEVEYSPVLLRRFLRKSKVKPLCMLPQRAGVTHWEHGQYALSTNLETLNALKLKTVTLADSSKARYERSRSSVEIDYSHLTWIYVYIYTYIYYNLYIRRSFNFCPYCCRHALHFSTRMIVHRQRSPRLRIGCWQEAELHVGFLTMPQNLLHEGGPSASFQPCWWGVATIWKTFYRQHLWSDWGPQGAQERQEQWLQFSTRIPFWHHFTEVTDVIPFIIKVNQVRSIGASKQMEQMGPALAAVHQRCIPQAGSDSVPASAENTWFWRSVAKKPRMLQEFHICDIYRHLTSTLVYSNTVNVPTACVDLYFYLLTNGSRRSDKQALVNQECINQHFLHVAWPIYRTGISKCTKASGLTNSPWHLRGQKAYHQSTIVHEELLLVRTCIVSHWKCTVQMSIVESWTSCQKLTQVAMSLRSWIWTDTFM